MSEESLFKSTMRHVWDDTPWYLKIILGYGIAYMGANIYWGLEGNSADWHTVFNFTMFGMAFANTFMSALWQSLIDRHEESGRNYQEIVERLKDQALIALEQRDELAKDCAELKHILAQHGVHVEKQKRTLQ